MFAVAVAVAAGDGGEGLEPVLFEITLAQVWAALDTDRLADAAF